MAVLARRASSALTTQGTLSAQSSAQPCQNALAVSSNRNEKAPPAARVAAANALLDRGYGKPTQSISKTLAKIDPSTMSDEELAAIVRNGIQADDRLH
jgi:hypothetical protein